MPKNDKRVETGEVMSNVAYSQPHNVQKYRPELGGQVSMVCQSYFFIIDKRKLGCSRTRLVKTSVKIAIA